MTHVGGRTGGGGQPAARRQLAAELRKRREAVGLSQRALARATYFSSSYVTKLETGAEFPSLRAISCLDAALGASGTLVALARAASAERRNHRAQEGAEQVLSIVPDLLWPAGSPTNVQASSDRPDEEAPTQRRDVLRMGVAGTVAGMASAAAGIAASATATASLLADATLGSMERVQWVATSNVDAATLAQLHVGVDQVVETWEHRTAADLLPHVLRHRHWVDRLLRGHQHPDQQRELYLVASRLAGLLAYLSFDLGDFGSARTHCVEALAFAEHCGHGPMEAWVRGTQAMISLYSGRYRESLEYARDGLRRTSDPVQAARLACFGEARALARLGDRTGVQAAVGRARDAMDRHGPAPSTLPARAGDDGPDGPVGPAGHSDVSFTSFSRAQLALYTGTALVVSGDAENARGHSTNAVTMYTRAGFPGLSSLARVDLATALVRGPRPDPERAAATVHAALAATAERPYDSLGRRVAEFFAIAAPYRQVQTLRDAAEQYRGWRNRLLAASR